LENPPMDDWSIKERKLRPQSVRESEERNPRLPLIDKEILVLSKFEI
jgi:hypothetical protein